VADASQSPITPHETSNRASANQQRGRRDNPVAVYEQVFKSLSALSANRALEYLDLRPGERLIDVGAGAGAAALMAAARGAHVRATDASLALAARIAVRANDAATADRVRACVMDGMALDRIRRTARWASKRSRFCIAVSAYSGSFV
jgi:protein-L-isoaspartate O-methyltransferase